MKDALAFRRRFAHPLGQRHEEDAMTDRIDAIAREIYRQHKARETYRSFMGDEGPRDMAEAYAAQFRFHELHAEKGRGAIGGRKIALASKVQQQLCGVDEPIVGGIFAREIFHGPKTLRHADYHGLGLEFELAAVMGEDIAPGDGRFDAETVRARVASIHPAFEIIIDRNADYETLTALSMAADNAWNGGVVLGPALEEWRDADVDEWRGALFWNDEPPVDARLGDADPFGSLAWMANIIAGAGQTLRKGDVVITGSVIRTRYPKPGERARYRIADRAEAVIEIV